LSALHQTGAEKMVRIRLIGPGAEYFPIQRFGTLRMARLVCRNGRAHE
jgi:hypothetical protein